MTDKIVEPEGSIEIQAEKDGIPASVTLYFSFSGDWSNLYDNKVDSEDQARVLFIREVQRALEVQRNEARGGDETGRPSRSED